MKINRNNYEVFFIDFYDGKLTDMQQLEMELFLDNNPDLKIEFDEFENITVDAAKISFSHKRALKKPEIVKVSSLNEENYEEVFIAWHENDLDINEKAKMLSFLESNPHLEKEFQSHASLLLKKEDIVFEDKDSLKKKTYIGYYWYGAAAAILIFLALGFFLIQNRPTPSLIRYEIARIESLAISKQAVAINLSNHIIKTQEYQYNNIELPAPGSIENELPINMLASIEPSSNILEQNTPTYLIEWNYVDETILLANMDKARKRGFLAQFFRKNVADVTESLGIENTMADRSVKKKKDPGFVKFLDGSLTVFNTITGSDAELVKNYDHQGNLKNYSLEGQSFVVNRKLPVGRSSD